MAADLREARGSSILLFDPDLPVAGLGDGGPGDLPCVQVGVDASEDELSALAALLPAGGRHRDTLGCLQPSVAADSSLLLAWCVPARGTRRGKG